MVRTPYPTFLTTESPTEIETPVNGVGGYCGNTGRPGEPICADGLYCQENVCMSPSPSEVPSMEPTACQPVIVTEIGGYCGDRFCEPVCDVGLTCVDFACMQTEEPTVMPTEHPSETPTILPTYVPSFDPSMDPTFDPSYSPSDEPSSGPTLSPTMLCDEYDDTQLVILCLKNRLVELKVELAGTQEGMDMV